MRSATTSDIEGKKKNERMTIAKVSENERIFQDIMWPKKKSKIKIKEGNNRGTLQSMRFYFQGSQSKSKSRKSLF